MSLALAVCLIRGDWTEGLRFKEGGYAAGRPRIIVLLRQCGGLELLWSAGPTEHWSWPSMILGGILELFGQRVCRPGWLHFRQCGVCSAY